MNKKSTKTSRVDNKVEKQEGDVYDNNNDNANENNYNDNRPFNIYDNDDRNGNDNDNDINIKLNSNINFISLDINEAKTLNPMTHIYQFDIGFPAELLENIGHKFNISLYTKYFISFHPPRDIINAYNFKVIFLNQLLTSCYGSGEGHTVYFYKKITDSDMNNRNPGESTDSGYSGVVQNHEKRVILQKRRDDEEDVTLVCEEAFLEAIQVAVGPIKDLQEHSAKIVDNYLSSNKPIRPRKPNRRFTELYEC